MHEDSKNWVHIKKAQLNAIFQAIREVELGVVLSTVTRLFAFGAMFFVTGMMGSYMQPIPKYAIVAMIASTIIALSINPFLTDLFYNLFHKAPHPNPSPNSLPSVAGEGLNDASPLLQGEVG